MLMPELQRMAQNLGIPGAGRMRKGQLVEAIEARQGGGPRQEGGPARQGSDQRAASAGADATRPLRQDGMEPGTGTRTGIGDSAAPGIGDANPAARDGIGGDGAGQQLSFYEEAGAQAAERPGRRDGAVQAGAQPGEPAQGDTQRADRRRRNGQPSRRAGRSAVLASVSS